MISCNYIRLHTCMKTFFFQLANIKKHLTQVAFDVARYIPSSNFTGLAVIDWESWRPIFDRNGYNEEMKIYIHASKNLVRKMHPDWSEDMIENEARKEFEASARYCQWYYCQSENLIINNIFSKIMLIKLINKNNLHTTYFIPLCICFKKIHAIHP